MLLFIYFVGVNILPELAGITRVTTIQSQICTFSDATGNCSVLFIYKMKNQTIIVCKMYVCVCVFFVEYMRTWVVGGWSF